MADKSAVVSFDPSQLDLTRPEHAAEILWRLSLNEIAQAWCAYHETNDERHWWAVELMWSDPYLADRARRERFLEILIETAPNDDVLGAAAAGPLEDAIYDSEECVSWLEARARTSVRFRQALGQIWIWDAVSPERFSRIERAAGRPLPRTR
jgi:hypothetical protein